MLASLARLQPQQGVRIASAPNRIAIRKLKRRRTSMINSATGTAKQHYCRDPRENVYERLIDRTESCLAKSQAERYPAGPTAAFGSETF
jgi:hypothetical protein